MRYPTGTAAAHGIVSCIVCQTPHAHQSKHCNLCGARLSLRIQNSTQCSLAYLCAAIILYVPAMTLPIMETTQLGRTVENTIVQGAVTLWNLGSYFIAIVIFIASVLVPILKMIALFWLNWVVSRPHAHSQSQAMLVYHVTELVGKWSMVDVFVVALLVALIQMEPLMTIRPGPAALYFAGVVVLTMLSARAFDHRLIWDARSKPETTHE